MGICFKKIDLFAVPISFRYNKEESYSTILGGFFTLLIFIIGAVFGIYYFIPFIKKKNYYLYYNTINLSEAEPIRLEEINNALAIGLECDSDPNGKILEQYLDIKIKYYDKHKNKDGIYNKKDPINIPQNINYSICNYTEFYSKYNAPGNKNKNKTLKCINNINTMIQGRYGDNIFRYFEISLLSKNNLSNEDFKEIDELLLNQDCKLELHYTDIKMNFNKYKDPISPFVNEIFLQLNPESTVKMNTFFMNQYFDNDDDLFFTTKNDKKVKNLFSRTEQYFLYKGLNRGELRPKDYQYYAKIYIRADIKKIEVKRKYQNFFEFYSDTFSFWVALFYILDFFIFNSYNNFRANYSIQQKLFFFKNVKNDHFNIYDYQLKIQELIKKTENSSNKVNNNLNNNILSSPNIIQNKNGLKNINVLSNQNKNQNKNQNSYSNLKIPVNQNKPPIERLNTETSLNQKEKLIKYSFNVFGILIIRISRKYLKYYECFKCLCCKKLKFKAILFSKASNIIYSKLDIIFYLKNMMYLDKHQTLINNDKREIYKFISMPIISTNEREIKNNDFHKDYKEYKPYNNEDLDKFEKEISKIQKSKDNLKLLEEANNNLNEINKKDFIEF